MVIALATCFLSFDNADALASTEVVEAVVAVGFVVVVAVVARLTLGLAVVQGTVYIAEQ